MAHIERAQMTTFVSLRKQMQSQCQYSILELIIYSNDIITCVKNLIILLWNTLFLCVSNSLYLQKSSVPDTLSWFLGINLTGFSYSFTATISTPLLLVLLYSPLPYCNFSRLQLKVFLSVMFDLRAFPNFTYCLAGIRYVSAFIKSRC